MKHTSGRIPNEGAEFAPLPTSSPKWELSQLGKGEEGVGRHWCAPEVHCTLHSGRRRVDRKIQKVRGIEVCEFVEGARWQRRCLQALEFSVRTAGLSGAREWQWTHRERTQGGDGTSGHSVVNQQPKQQTNTFNNLKGWRGCPRAGGWSLERI